MFISYSIPHLLDHGAVNTLRVFERNIRRKIFDPVRVGDDFWFKRNNELYDLFNDLYDLLNNLDVVQSINVQRLLWFGHVVLVDD